MSCPDIEKLIVYGLGGDVDPEVRRHIESCETCQEDVATLRALSGAKEAEDGLAPELMARIMSDLPQPDATPQPEGPAWTQLLVTAILGFLTAVASLVLTGTIGSLPPAWILSLGSTFGLVAVLSARRDRAEVVAPEARKV